MYHNLWEETFLGTGTSTAAASGSACEAWSKNTSADGVLGYGFVGEYVG